MSHPFSMGVIPDNVGGDVGGGGVMPRVPYSLLGWLTGLEPVSDTPSDCPFCRGITRILLMS